MKIICFIQKHFIYIQTELQFVYNERKQASEEYILP